jgi:hypothetical protein
MLLSAIKIVNPYPNEKIDVSFNEIVPQLTNARFGVRFRYFYYDTWDAKINFRKTSDYTLVGTNSIGTALSATSPTNFLNPNDLAPFRWTVANEREYLYVTVLGGASAVTVWPTHPYPKITKNSNFALTIDIGVVSAAAFDSEITTSEFRKLINASSFATWTNSSSVISALTGSATLAGGKKNFEQAKNINYFRTLNIPSLAPNVISNSFRIDVPVITSTTVAVDQPDQIFILSFFNDNYTNDNYNYITNNFVTNLSCLESEALTRIGINPPYTTQALMNDKSGGILIELKSPLYIKPQSDIIVFYETSSPIALGGIDFKKNYVNNFSLSVVPGVYPNVPVYLFNYNFVSNSEDLLTITFQPSSFVTSQTVSSVEVETVMIDNYYQNTYDMPNSGNILFKRFIETSGDNTLVAYNPSTPSTTYVSEQWFPANGNQKITFKNNGKGNKHKIKIELKSVAGAVFEEDKEIEFLLNKNKVVMSLAVTRSTDSTAVVEANIFPTPSDEYKVKWAANPPENIIFQDRNENVLLPNTFYPLNVYAEVFNLGVDKTEIVLYSEEYDLSANTFWYPPSSIFGSAFLEIKGNVTDLNAVNTSMLSAFINRNGFSYRLPAQSNIIWNETANDPNGSLTLYTRDFTKQIKESTIYASSDNYSLINAQFSTIPVDRNPRQIIFNISCNAFRDDFNLTSTKMFFVRQYPSKQYLFIDAQKSGDTVVYRSDQYTNVFYASPGVISLSALYPDLNVNYSNIKWTYSYSNGSTGTATGSSLSLNLNTVSACVSLSALDATPVDGDFKKYNFTDTVCFYLNSAIQPFDYIGIPSNIYVPTYRQAIGDQEGTTSQLSFSDQSYLFSLGMSAFKPCHTEFFQLSATPGFQTYVWRIGTKIHRANNHITTIPVTFSDVSANNTIGVSAYDNVFVETNPVSIFNSAASNNSSVFKQHINFYDFPSPIVDISVTNNYINVEKYSETATLNWEINSLFTTLENYNANIVLSSSSFLQTYNINGNKALASKILKIGIENSDFIIKENSINDMVVFLSGNVGTNLVGFDYCTQYVPFTSNFVSLTAYNGPNLYLYTQQNIVSTGEIVSFFNGSNQNFASLPFSGFSSFIFDNGEGVIQNPSSPYITTTYTSEGSKSPSLTGILPNGTVYTKVWPKMVYVKNSFENYDPTIIREFYDELTMPFSLEQVEIPPNSWQFAETWNECFNKFRSNIQYLSAACSVNNLNFPKAEAGFLGSLFGNFKWHTTYTPQSVQNTIFKDLKSAQVINNKLLVINENRVEIYNITENPFLIYSFNRIGEGEILEIPTAIQYNAEQNRLFILDRGKSIIFVCNFDIENPQNIILTHYWGGVGERTDRTKLNNPVDFCVDLENRLYIVDKDSYIIKVYNKNINWIKNIQLSNFSSDNRPVCISEKDGNLCVLTEDSNIIIFDYEENIINSFFVPNCSRAVLNQIHDGILYAIVDNTIIKYANNGTRISSKTFIHPIIDLFFDEKSAYSLMSNYIVRFVDFVQIDKIIDSVEDKAGFSWNNIFIDHSEFTTAYIFNDSFQKIKDNISLLNDRINKKIFLDLDEYGNIINQYVSDVDQPPLSSLPILLATNEPVLYDTVNRSIQHLYSNLLELKDNIDVFYNYPNYNKNIKWTWKYHYVDFIQRPSLNKNPVSWIELRSDRIIGNTQLSSVSSWCSIREPGDANHSEICWNFEYTECNSYFPLSWEQTSCESDCGYPFTWEDLEKNCCRTPDIIFEDCVTVC